MKSVKLSIVTAVIVMAGFVVEGVAGDVMVDSTLPTVYFDDTDYTVKTYEWKIYSTVTNTSTGAGAWVLWDNKSNYVPIKIQAYTNPVPGIPYANNALWTKSDGDVCLAEDALCINRSTYDYHSLYVNSSGDVNLANGSVFIDRSQKRMGIGNVAPEGTLHAKGVGGNIIIEGTGYSKWQIAPIGGGGFWLKDILNSTIPFQIDGNVPTNTLRLSTAGNVGIGTQSPDAKLDVRGNIKSTWSGSNTAGDGLTSMAALEANNVAAGKTSDAGFTIRNNVDNFTWAFRTYSPGEGFAATKIGTGGTEFEVDNTGSTTATTVVKMGGVVVFKNGHLVNSSGQVLTSLVEEQSVKLAETKALLEAKDAEIIAMKAEAKAKGQKIAMMEAKMAKLELMQKRVTMMESILTNLALKTSDTDKAKVSMK